ncbi:MAG: YceI family protein [Flammeovirgaceae bacterium]
MKLIQYTVIAFFILLVLGFGINDTKEYELDVHHTFVTFQVERFMVGEVTGRFNELTGKISYDGNHLKSLKADVTIKTKSIDTGMEIRDGHLKSNTWLDAEQYPEMKLMTKEVFQKEGKNYVKADLTIHGVTQEVEIPFTLKGPFKDPTGAETIGIQAALTINRQDYGISFSKTMGNGELFIGNEVKIGIKALAILPRNK